MDQKSNLFKSLALAQSQINPPQKNRHYFRGSTKIQYADLASIMQSLKEPLSKNGLFIYHTMLFTELGFGLKTIVSNDQGESIETWHPLPEAHTVAPQQFGSNLTYARRYSVCALLGVVADDDDDGQDAVKPVPVELKKIEEKKKFTPSIKKESNPFENPPTQNVDKTVDNVDSEKSDLDKLVGLAAFHMIPNAEMSKYIKMATGREARAIALTDEELKKVINFINLKFK